MKRYIILIFLILLCVYTFTLIPKKDCAHPIIRRCIQAEMVKKKTHIAGKRYWRLPYFYCRTFLVNKNECYWKYIKERQNDFKK